MKRIIPLILVLGLAIIVLVQYFKLRSLSPPEAYAYTLKEDIDLNYHQPVAVGAYYDAGRNVALYARQVWHNEGFNVRMPDADDGAEMASANHYKKMLSYTDSLGARLSRSYQWKLEGFDNADILRFENEGLSPTTLRVEKVFGGSSFQKGDERKGVWALQDLLIQKGYQMPHDGNFWEETHLALKAFQTKSGLPPTGIADIKTLTQLLNP